MYCLFILPSFVQKWICLKCKLPRLYHSLHCVSLWPSWKYSLIPQSVFSAQPWQAWTALLFRWMRPCVAWRIRQTHTVHVRAWRMSEENQELSEIASKISHVCICLCSQSICVSLWPCTVGWLIVDSWVLHSLIFLLPLLLSSLCEFRHWVSFY